MKSWQKTVALIAFLVFLAGSFVRGWQKAGADIENPKILRELVAVERERRDAEERVARVLEAGRPPFVFVCRRMPREGQLGWVRWIEQHGECERAQ